MIQNNPDWIFCFGDNEARVGRGGQAKECRDEPNTIGIRTKRKPEHGKDAYWTDDTFVSNREMIIEDFLNVVRHLASGKTIVFPEDGFGTGMAKLATNAPNTLNVIQVCVEEIKKAWDNEESANTAT